VKQELDADMATFGFEIVNVLVTDIVPDAKVKSAMNDINAAQREQVAANARGEAEKILVVKKAEAEAESKALQGQGIANQRKAIIEGLRGSIEQFRSAVADVTTSEVMQLVMVTQYFDTIKSIGELDKTNTLFLSHSPAAVRDISDQIMQSVLIAEKAKVA
jgi:regulator of protease activity HflC (stomatin/prohibitin superfamily)